MTTGATGQLGLALPVQGELSGTWGDTVNNGITQYTNIAIAGTLTLTNDGAVTLANTTGDASASNITSTLTGAGTVTAQFAIVKVTGTLTVAKVVTAPSYSKTYTVVNAATGGIVTFKASGQTGVSIAVGETAFVYYNGTDYVKIVGTATAGAAGGSTTQVQYNNGGVLAGITGATTNGTALTLVAPNLGSPASVGTMPAFTLGGTVSGGGNQINNVIIGTSTPLAGSFTTLTATKGSAGLVAYFLSGNAAQSPYISIGRAAEDVRIQIAAATNDLFTGTVAGDYATNSNASIWFGTGGNPITKISSTGLAVTGAISATTAIGTTSGGTGLTSFTSGGVVYASSSSALATGSVLNFDGSNLSLVEANGSGAKSILMQGGATGGDYGIISVANGSTIRGRIVADASSDVFRFDTAGGASTAYTWLIGASYSEGMRLTTTGLGIGTSSPAYKLHISSTAATGAITMFSTGTTTAYNLGQFTNTGGSFYYGLDNSAGTTFTGSTAYASLIGTGNSTNLHLITSNTVRATIDSSGNVGIGTSSPNAPLTFASSTGRKIGFYQATQGYSIGVEASNFKFVTDSSAVFTWANGSTYSTATEYMRLDSSGNLGLGTSSPQAKVHSTGAILSSGALVALSASNIFIDQATSAISRIGLVGANTSTYGTLKISQYSSDGSLGRDAITLDSSGNLGLGVTPSAWDSTYKVLQISSRSSFYGASGETNINNNGYYNGGWKYVTTGGAGIYSLDANSHKFYVAPSGTAGTAISFTQAMTLDASGRLGVGITSPSYKLNTQVAPATAAYDGIDLTDGSYTVVGLYKTGATYSYGMVGAGQSWIYSNRGDLNIMSDTNGGAIKFATGGGTERARIDSSGNLLVGTTSANPTVVGARVIASATIPVISVAISATSNNYLLYNTTAGAYRFFVSDAGQINATSITISAISDQRLKENVRDIDTGLNSIMALKPRRFDWKEGKGQDKKNVAGFIAQEFEDVFPECVSTSIAGEDGIEYKNINHETLIPTLVKAIQELKTEFDAYKASHP